MSLARKAGVVFVGLFLVVLLAVPIGLWWWQRAGAMNPLEQWCAAQLRRMSGDLLTPQLDFSSLQLELPAAVTLDEVSFTSDGGAIIRMSSMRLEFSQPPKRGQPLVIEAAMFVEPMVRLIGKPDGTLQGWSGFVKSTTGKRYEDGGSSKPSDFLSIKRLTITDGAVEWAPAKHEHPMRFDKLEMALTASPEPSRPGWYAFDANIERTPVVQLAWKGGISIDTGDLALDDTTLEVDLSEDEYASLAPSIQDVLRRYAIVGDLTLHVNGHVPLTDARATDLTFDATLKKAGAAIGAYQIPIDSAEMKATFRQMQLSCDTLAMKAFGGQVDSSGTLGFTDGRPFSLKTHAEGVLLQDILRPVAKQPPRFAGKIGLDVDLSGDLGSSLSGSGTLKIADAKLIGVPAVGALADELEGHGPRKDGNDRGEIDFTLSSDRGTIKKLLLQSRWLAARATGDIYYDGRLDLKVNAGVVEKAESLLGALGDVLGALTDHLLPYIISGTWSKPTVTPDPLGLPLGEKRGADK